MSNELYTDRHFLPIETEQAEPEKVGLNSDLWSQILAGLVEIED